MQLSPEIGFHAGLDLYAVMTFRKRTAKSLYNEFTDPGSSSFGPKSIGKNEAGQTVVSIKIDDAIEAHFTEDMAKTLLEACENMGGETGIRVEVRDFGLWLLFKGIGDFEMRQFLGKAYLSSPSHRVVH